jgi:hypothetical protein
LVGNKEGEREGGRVIRVCCCAEENSEGVTC